MSDLTHASFFSGVGGLDMGLERAGWTTVSFSEIDPYASAVLARHWPAVPNLGSITDLAGGRSGVGSGEQLRQHAVDHGDWTRADLWSGGFPCQDLSVAGKRRGMGTDAERSDTRSGLAYAFLDLVERYRPPAILLENVPGLLSSHRGRDFYALQRRMAELGYVGAYRILDARYFGVPQRRRRVFIVALDARRGATADDAAEVLSVGSRCDRHPASGGEERSNAADGVGAGISRSLSTSQERIDADTESFVVGILTAPDTRHRVVDGKRQDGSRRDRIPVVVGPSPDPGGVRAPDGLAGRLDDRAGVEVAATRNSGGNDGGFRTEPGEHLTDAPTGLGDDPLLPLGLDSHRYRCCGNGVVAPVAEYVGERLAAVVQRLWD
jgi:DNA-cytosine methyltransferase